MSRAQGAGGSSARGKGPPASRPRPSAAAPRAGPSREPAGGRRAASTKQQGACKPAGAGKAQGKAKAAEKDALPAFSLPASIPSLEEEHREKQRIIRRNKPAGEDLNKLREIIKALPKRTTTVYEFIGLVAPSTGDNGRTLHSVLARELSLFQTTTRKIFDTMTEDISDVLVNEQIQLKEYSLERHELYEGKMQRALNGILDHCPEFSFERFFTSDAYLSELFPLSEVNIDQDELEALLRQEAYHRYHWLKTEGVRLKDENGRLQKRLKELKTRQRDQLQEAAAKEQRAEDQRKILEVTQEMLEERLDELNESVNKALVESELAQAEAVCLQPAKAPPKTGAKLKTPGATRARAAWAAKQAAEIEAKAANETLNAETRMLTVRSKSSAGRTSAKSKLKRPPPRPIRPTSSTGQTSPFHYSPPKTPPTKEPAARQTSPFHYSPPKTPPGAGSRSPGAAGQPQSPRMSVSTSRVLTEQQCPPAGGLRSRGPQDTWGGFK